MPITYTNLACNNAWAITVSLNLAGDSGTINIPLISPISNVWTALGGYTPSSYSPMSGLITITGNQYSYTSTLNFSTAQWTISITALGNSPQYPTGMATFSASLFYSGV